MEMYHIVEVKVEPFPTTPFTDDQFEDIAEQLHALYGHDLPGLSSSQGVLQFEFDDDALPIRSIERAREVAELLVSRNIEAAEISGRIVWSIMQ